MGIPPDGSAYILRRDPLTQGHSVLDRRCLGCHAFEGKGNGTQTASDLRHFGSREWVRGLLENPASASYFGSAKKLDGMSEWKKSSKLTAKELDDVADFVATFASIPDGHDARRLAELPGRRRSPRAQAIPEGVWDLPRRRRGPRAKGACAMRPSSSAGDHRGGSLG